MRALATDGYEVALIPAGHTFAAVTQALADGATIGGLTDEDSLYGDSIHPSNAGRYISALSAFSAVYDTDTIGAAMPNGFRLTDYGAQLDSQGIDAVQRIAFQTHLQLTAVPEPMSGCILTVLSLGVLVRQLQRRRKRDGESTCRS